MGCVHIRGGRGEKCFNVYNVLAHLSEFHIGAYTKKTNTVRNLIFSVGSGGEGIRQLYLLPPDSCKP